MLFKKSNRLFFLLILIISLVPILIDLDNSLYNYLVVEDGVIEYLTALFLLISSFICLKTFLNIKKKSILNFGILISAIALFFGFGEEISWGQRILNYQTPLFFNDNNLQNETNIHNLAFDGIKLNKWIFTYTLVFIFSFYFFIMPLLYKWNLLPKTIFNNFSLFVPTYFQSFIFFLSTIFINLFKDSKISEIWECSFAVTILFVCLYPLNNKGN